MARVIGVKYIGASDTKEDTVCNTGAVWIPNQIHNFAESIARELLVHTDSFEEVKPDMNGGIYMEGKINGKNIVEPAAFVNVSAMGIDEMAVYARREFNKVLDTSKPEEEIRAEIQSLMSIAVLDQIERDNTLPEVENIKVTIKVNPAEHEALLDGSLKVQLVPAEAQIQSVGMTADEARAIVDHFGIASLMEDKKSVDELFSNNATLGNALVALGVIAELVDVEEPTLEPKSIGNADVGLADAAVAPSIDDINVMGKDDLLSLAAKHSIEVNDKAPAVTLRKQIVEAINQTV